MAGAAGGANVGLTVKESELNTELEGLRTEYAKLQEAHQQSQKESQDSSKEIEELQTQLEKQRLENELLQDGKDSLAETTVQRGAQ